MPHRPVAVRSHDGGLTREPGEGATAVMQQAASGSRAPSAMIKLA
jgi:hypothetical protein